MGNKSSRYNEKDNNCETENTKTTVNATSSSLPCEMSSSGSSKNHHHHHHYFHHHHSSSSTSHHTHNHRGSGGFGHGLLLRHSHIYRHYHKNQPTEPFRLNDCDLAYLCRQTELNEAVIKSIFNKFCEDNPTGYLNRREFVRLYCSLRCEPESDLVRIAEFAFNAFDADKNGFIDFKEFVVSWIFIFHIIFHN